MKVAVPTRGNLVDDHFGHCEVYTIYSINAENKIDNWEYLPSPQGCGCKSNIAGILQAEGVDTLLAGSMGEGALNILSSHGIKVYRGCSGEAKTVVETFLQGNVKDSGKGCHHHEGEGHQCNH
jgi:predicted Fe-Mo cluster-binding NifX family protein